MCAEGECKKTNVLYETASNDAVPIGSNGAKINTRCTSPKSHMGRGEGFSSLLLKIRCTVLKMSPTKGERNSPAGGGKERAGDMLRAPLTASRGSCNTVNRATPGPAAEPGANGRRTACTTDSSTRELYHGCPGHEWARRRTGRAKSLESSPECLKAAFLFYVRSNLLTILLYCEHLAGLSSLYGPPFYRLVDLTR